MTERADRVGIGWLRWVLAILQVVVTALVIVAWGSIWGSIRDARAAANSAQAAVESLERTVIRLEGALSQRITLNESKIGDLRDDLREHAAKSPAKAHGD